VANRGLREPSSIAVAATAAQLLAVTARRSDGRRNCSNNPVARRIGFNVAHMMATEQTRPRLICRRRQSPATGAGA
jgi:hypothetical protein